MMECRQCRVGWHVLRGDQFCGFCGRPVCDLQPSFDPPWLYVDQPVRDLSLVLENCGSLPLQIGTISCVPPWNYVSPQESIVLHSGQIQRIPFRNSGNLEIGVNQIEIQATGLKQPRKITLSVHPAPSIHPPQEPLRIFTQEQNLSDIPSFFLDFLVAEAPIHILHITTPDPWWTIEQTIPPGTLFNPGEYLRITGQINLSLLAKHTGKISGTVSLQISGRLTPIDVPIHLLFQRKPKIRIYFNKNTPFHQSAYKLYHHLDESSLSDPLRIEIESHTDQLIIREIRWIADDRGATARSLRSLPLETRASTTEHDVSVPLCVTIPFVLIRGNRQCGTRPYYITVEVVCDPPFVLKEKFPVEISQGKKLYAAVDFGTSNSCLAYATGGGEEPSLIDLEPKKKLCPTWLFYQAPLDLSQSWSGEWPPSQSSRFRYVIGTDAETQRGRSSGKVEANNFVRTIKRKLGSNQTLWFHFTEDSNTYGLLPKQIARDYISKLFDQLAPLGEIQHLIVTHPTRFSKRQVLELREAAYELGYRDDQLLFIDEASAAVFYYIIQEKEKNLTALSREFLLMMYDFGGGTTDLTVSRIIIPHENDPDRKLTIETLAAGGLRDLGGEDITNIIVQKLILPTIHDICIKEIYANFQSLQSLEILYFSPSDQVQASDYKTSLQSTLLYEMAEEVKIKLSDVEAFEQDRILQIEHKVNGKRQNSKEIRLKCEWTRAELEAHLRPELQRAIDYLKGMLEGKNLSIGKDDLLLLAGQSSQIPLLKKMLHETFAPCRIEMLSRMKECVSIGACQYLGFHKNRDSKEEIQLKQFDGVTRFSYGYLAKSLFGPDYIKELVPQFTDVDKEFEIKGFPAGTSVEFYQNATPWNSIFRSCDKDLIGYITVGGPMFANLSVEHCRWFLHVHKDETIELVVREYQQGSELIKTEVRFAMESERQY